MPKLISPDSLDSADVEKLVTFFDTQTRDGHYFWPKNKTYCFADNVEFRFSHDVIQRQSKKGGVRYEFISLSKVGGGTEGLVFDVERSLEIQEHDFIFRQKNRVIKSEKKEKLALNGYRLMTLANHLGAKQPVYANGRYYTVMRKAAGRELFDLLQDDLKGVRVLTSWKRILLAQLLLEAMDEQVVKKGIIHRDIKCENTHVYEVEYWLVSMGTDPLSCPFESIALRLLRDNGIIFFNDELYYANKTKKSVTRIAMTDSNRDAYQQLLSKTRASFWLAEDLQLKLIADIGLPLFQIKLLDYSLGGTMSECLPGCFGTPGYIAPEMLDGSDSGKDPGVDVYAMGIILAQLFHAYIMAPAKDTLEAHHNAALVACRLPELFLGLLGPNSADRDIIRSTLAAMLNPCPADRISLKEARQRFAQLGLPVSTPQASASSSSSGSGAGYSAAFFQKESDEKTPDSKQNFPHIQ